MRVKTGSPHGWSDHLAIHNWAFWSHSARLNLQEPFDFLSPHFWWICPPFQESSLPARFVWLLIFFSFSVRMVKAFFHGLVYRYIKLSPLWMDCLCPCIGSEEKPSYCLETTHLLEDVHRQQSSLPSSTQCLGKELFGGEHNGNIDSSVTGMRRVPTEAICLPFCAWPWRRYAQLKTSPEVGPLQWKGGWVQLWGLLQTLQCCSSLHDPGHGTWHCPAAPTAPGGCGPSLHSYFPLPGRERVRDTVLGLHCSSEVSLLSRAENLPSWSSISQRASLWESFKNAQLSRCPHSGSM